MIILKCDLCKKPYGSVKNPKNNYTHKKCLIKQQNELKEKQHQEYQKNFKPFKETGKYYGYPPYPQAPDSEAGRKYPIINQVCTTK